MQRKENINNQDAQKEPKELEIKLMFWSECKSMGH